MFLSHVRNATAPQTPRRGKSSFWGIAGTLVRFPAGEIEFRQGQRPCYMTGKKMYAAGIPESTPAMYDGSGTPAGFDCGGCDSTGVSLAYARLTPA